MSQTQTPAGSPIGKPADEFRNYAAEARDTVKEFYRLNHKHQTLDFVLDKKREYLGLNRKRMKVWEALEYLDTLVDDPTGKWLVTSPSLSPENAHPYGTSLAIGPTMDQQILRDLFASVTTAARALGVDPDLQARWTATRGHRSDG